MINWPTCRWPGCFKKLAICRNSNKRLYCTYHHTLKLKAHNAKEKK